jgi:hypothetical protein
MKNHNYLENTENILEFCIQSKKIVKVINILR